jgi:hypothetical protein
MGLEPMLLLNTSGKYLSKVESNTLLVGYASIPLSHILFAPFLSISPSTSCCVSVLSWVQMLDVNI